jgi:hypothetical protein
VTDNNQKYALLLHTADMDVQDIFCTLPDGAGNDKYERAVSALDTYFKPQTHSTFERSLFWAMPVASETLQLGIPVTSGNKTLSIL